MMGADEKLFASAFLVVTVSQWYAVVFFPWQTNKLLSKTLIQVIGSALPFSSCILKMLSLQFTALYFWCI